MSRSHGINELHASTSTDSDDCDLVWMGFTLHAAMQTNEFILPL
ncbi:MAG: hypothetical protein P8M10_04885 [Ilumatobacter sp.]|nr:hypothetical protein [Ilumatobacter sp.]MDG2438631.1 hypothetical protein [Ilumatobacter sp.]